MTIQDYRRAVDCFEPDVYMKRRIAARLEREEEARRARPRRALVRALVIAAAVVCLATAALAASPRLRQMVISLFRIEEVEQVPGPSDLPTGSEAVTSIVLGDEVTVQYVRLPGAGSGYSYGSGVLFQVERDDSGGVTAVRYWAAEGDNLIPLETHATSFATAWEGVAYTDTVYWCVYEGAVSCYCGGSAGLAADAGCAVSSLDGRTNAVLLTLSQGSQISYRERPMLLELDTGEVTDLLAGTGGERIGQLRESFWSPDLSAAVLVSDENGLRQDFLYCDRTAGTTFSLSERTGLEVFSAFFSGGGELVLLTRSGPEETCYDIWTWQPDSGRPTRTFSQLPAYGQGGGQPYGFQFFFGNGRGLYLSEDGQVRVLDLTTGQSVLVEGLSLSQWDGTFIPNGAGTKLLFARYDGGADGLGISSLGVLDLEQGAFTAFDRDGYDSLHESSLGWFDENRVVIWGRREDYQSQYLYLYEF